VLNITSLFIPIYYRKNERFVLNIIKWVFIGLLVRVILMPFTMDADILWINYIPHQLSSAGVWDPYTFARDNFPGRILGSSNPYYPPFLFYILAFFQMILQKFACGLGDWFNQYASWLKLGGGFGLGHATFFTGVNIFRNLFILKLPLLLFDFAIGFMLLRLAADSKKAGFVFKLWMLNPVVLHSAYASGQVDIYATFFVILALKFAADKRPYFAVSSLALGTLIKSYPLILAPLAVAYLAKTFKEAFKLSALFLLMLIVFYLPTFISSTGYSLVSLFPGGTIGTSSTNLALMLMKFLFLLSVLVVLGHIYWQKKGINHFNLENYFFLTLLLFFAFQPIGLRFYIWLTPLLFLQFTRDRKLMIVALLQLLVLMELRMPFKALWLGLFAPLHPEFSYSLPVPDYFIGQFIDPIIVHKLMYRIFIILTLYMAYRTYRRIKFGVGNG